MRNPLTRGLLGLFLLSSSLFAASACTRETTALDESVALCGERHDARPGHFGLVPRLASNGSFIRTFSATLHRGGAHKPIALSNSRGCVFVDRNATGVLVVTGDAQGQPVGGRVVLDGKQDKMLSQITLAPLASPERFKACGEDGPRPTEEIRVVRADESPVLARDIALLDAQGNPLSAATRPAVTPLGCVGTTRAPSFVVASQSPAAQAYVGEDERRAGLVRLDERLEPGLTRACATNFSESQREQIAAREIAVLVPKFDGPASPSSATWSACSNDICEEKDWLLLSARTAAGRGLLVPVGKCLAVSRNSSALRLRAFTDARPGNPRESGEIVLSQRLEPKRELTKSQSTTLSFSRFVPAEQLARAWVAFLPQCARTRGLDAVYVDVHGELIVNIDANRDGVSSWKSSDGFRIVLRDVEPNAIIRSKSFPASGTETQSLSWSTGILPQASQRFSSGHSVSIEVQDRTGRSAELPLRANCKIFAENPLRIEKTLIRETNLKPGSFISLFDSLPNERDAGVKFSYKLTRISVEESKIVAPEVAKYETFSDQTKCLESKDYQIAANGIVPLRGGFFRIEVRACSLSGVVVRTEEKNLTLDATRPMFSLRPAWTHFSRGGEGALGVDPIPVLTSLDPVYLEIHNLRDDALSFEELSQRVDCYPRWLNWDFLSPQTEASCKIIEKNPSREYIILKVEWTASKKTDLEKQFIDDAIKTYDIDVYVKDDLGYSTRRTELSISKDFGSDKTSIVARGGEYRSIDPRSLYAGESLIDKLSFTLLEETDSITSKNRRLKNSDSVTSENRRCIFEGIQKIIESSQYPIFPGDYTDDCVREIESIQNIDTYGMEHRHRFGGFWGGIGGPEVNFRESFHWQSRRFIAIRMRPDFPIDEEAGELLMSFRKLVKEGEAALSMGRVVRRASETKSASYEEILWDGFEYFTKAIRHIDLGNAACMECVSFSRAFYVSGEPVLFNFHLPRELSAAPNDIHAFQSEGGEINFVVKSKIIKFNKSVLNRSVTDVPFDWEDSSLESLNSWPPGVEIDPFSILRYSHPDGSWNLEPVFKAGDLLQSNSYANRLCSPCVVD